MCSIYIAKVYPWCYGKNMNGYVVDYKPTRGSVNVQRSDSPCDNLSIEQDESLAHMWLGKTHLKLRSLLYIG